MSSWRNLYPAGGDTALALAVRRAIARAGDLEPGPMKEKDVDDVVTLAALWLEYDMREFFAGRQPTGVIRFDSRSAIVTESDTPREVAAFLRSQTPSAGAQALLDRGLWLLRRALDEAHARFLEWDRPGYSDVTESYAALLSFAAGRGPLDDEPVFEEPGAHLNVYERVARAGVACAAGTDALRRGLLLVVALLLPLVLIFALTASSRMRKQRAPSGTLASCDDAVVHAEQSLEREIAQRDANLESTRVLQRALEELRARRYSDASRALAANGEMANDPMLTVPLLAVEVACRDSADSSVSVVDASARP